MNSATTTRGWMTSERYRPRLAMAMTFSLLVHALILSLQFGLPGIGLPSLELPWRERHTQDLSVVLADATSPPGAPAVSATVEPEPLPPRVEVPVDAPPTTGARLQLVPLPVAPKLPATDVKPKNKTATTPRISRKKSPPKAPPVIALSEPRPDSFVLPAPALDEQIPDPAPPVTATDPTPAKAEETQRAEEAAAQAMEQEQSAQKLAAEAEARRQTDEAARQQAAQKRAEETAARNAQELEAKKQQEALKQEQARAERQALELEARKQAEETTRQQAALALQKQLLAAQKREQEEAARKTLELEAEKREEALRLEQAKVEREAIELVARRQAEETARQQAAALARQKQAEELAARQKAEAETTATAAAARQREPELVLGDSPPAGSARAWDDKRPPDTPLPRNLLGGGLAGKALEQARRPDILRTEPQLARQPDAAADNPRRRSLFSSADRDVGLMMYVESWRLKIERNGGLNYPKSAVEKAHGDPVVTVSVRSDGSVEEIIINRSSGRPELDEAVRRIVRLNARYSAFPPELARRFDVIEIRCVWNFDNRLRILEEVR